MTILNFLIALDRKINWFFGGSKDETLSSHFYRLKQANKPMGFMATVTDFIFEYGFQQKDHCLRSYLYEQKRKLP